MRYLLKNLFIIGIMLCQHQLLFGQQLPLFHQNIEDLNPAFIPDSYHKYNLNNSIDLRYRMQWVDIKDAPRTMSGSFTNWNDDYNLLLGTEVINDVTGPTQFTGVYGKVGYGVMLDRDWQLNFALKGGVVQYRVKGDKLNFLESGDYANNNANKIYPDFSLGTMLYFKEKYYVGMAVPQVMGLNLDVEGENGDFKVKRVQHYYGVAGARFAMYDQTWLELSSEVRYLANVPIYFNGNLSLELQEMLWVTASMSSSKELRMGIGFFEGIGDSMLKAGYVFSHFFQGYGPDYGSTHELTVRISWY